MSLIKETMGAFFWSDHVIHIKGERYTCFHRKLSVFMFQFIKYNQMYQMNTNKIILLEQLIWDILCNQRTSFDLESCTG